MEGAEEATIHPDGSASYEEPLLNETFEGNNETNFEDGGLPENDAVPSIDPAFYLILGVAVLLGLYFYFVLRKKVQEGEDEFFSNLDGDKVGSLFCWRKRRDVAVFLASHKHKCTSSTSNYLPK